jgi:UPF0755 protein
MLETLPKRNERRPPKENRRRRGLIVLVASIAVLAATTFAVGSWYTWATGASGPQTPVVVVIEPGATGGEVAALLKENDVIRSTFAFKLQARFRGFSGGFQAGKYNLTTNMTISAVLTALKKGPFVESVSATFPEGLTVSETAGKVEEQLGITAADFVKAATSGDFSLPPYLPKDKDTVEGFLFPDTYDFLTDTDAAAVINRLLQQFQTVADTLPWDQAKTLGVSNYEVVVIASMIEEEAKFDEDRAKIAAVIYNRLEAGMPLQIDATIQYALGKHKARLTNRDLDIKSPYNTYLHTGLPPTPIASPGAASLAAALNPVKADYLYYVVCDDEGHHAFTNNYDEFLQLRDQGHC